MKTENRWLVAPDDGESLNVLVIDLGGNAKKLEVTVMPPGYRLGDNSFAFIGGFWLWESAIDRVADLSL